MGALAAAVLAAGSLVSADEPIVVTSCPGQERIPVTFQLDCSHVRDPAARAQCRPFIENQACKVFPAYRRITGINLEKACPEITYTIYDKDQCRNGYEAGFARLKKEAFDPNLEQRLARLAPEQRCPMAEVNEEARFNRMFDKVSQGRAKKLLLDHGCAPW